MSSVYFGKTGLTLDAKPSPFVTSPWGDDTIPGVENGTTGEYTFATDDTKVYGIFKRLGGSPASSDKLIAYIAAAVQALQGPYTRTITVLDDDTDEPIQLAKVRLYRTGESESKTANSDGIVEFTTEAATFSYSVTANGYSGASGTIVISADGTTEIRLTVNPTTSEPIVGTCLVADYVYRSNGVTPLAGAEVRAFADKGMMLADAGIATHVISKATTNENGYFELRLPQKSSIAIGQKYRIEIKYDGSNVCDAVEGYVPDQSACGLLDIKQETLDG